MKSVGEVMSIGRTFRSRSTRACAPSRTAASGSAPSAPLEIDDDELEAALVRPTARPPRRRRRGADPRLGRRPRQRADRHGPVVRRPDAHAGRAPPRAARLRAPARRPRRRCCGPPSATGSPTPTSPRSCRPPRRPSAPAATSRASAPSTRPSTPARPSSRRTRPYHYSTYEDGGRGPRLATATRSWCSAPGPNRIGQGVEFDYCCVHAVFALQEAGYETIMVNCNPETVSTDYDTADRLYFEPLTFEDVLEVVDREQPVGVIVQMGGQTPLKLARRLAGRGRADHRHLARGHRRRRGPRPVRGADARARARHARGRRWPARPTRPREIARPHRLPGAGAPVLRARRPGHGDRLRRRTGSTPTSTTALSSPDLADEVTGQSRSWSTASSRARSRSTSTRCSTARTCSSAACSSTSRRPGVHSGDSACTLPPITLSRSQVAADPRLHPRASPRAWTCAGWSTSSSPSRTTRSSASRPTRGRSRTVPFVSKATGVPLAKIAARVMAGDTARGAAGRRAWCPSTTPSTGPRLPHIAVKEAVLPFDRFPGVDSLLGPEMRSTGEVMGIDVGFGAAFAKSQAGTGSMVLPTDGTVFVSVANRDKRVDRLPGQAPGRPRLRDRRHRGHGRPARARRHRRRRGAARSSTGDREMLDMLDDGDVTLGAQHAVRVGHARDGYEIREAAVTHGVPCITTLAGILAAIQGIEALTTGRCRHHRCRTTWPRLRSALRDRVARA